MILLIIFVFLLIVLMLLIMISYLYIKNKTGNFFKDIFGTTDIKKVVEMTNAEDENTPKSVSSMESIYLSKLKKDYPTLNINELKSEVESVIRKTLDAIENKDTEAFKNYSKINAFINNQIDDYKKKEVSFSSIHFHKTVLSSYEKKSGIATIRFHSSLEYKKKVNNGIEKKVQTRLKSECIYIIDESKVSNSKKALGLNCPNCGAPIRSIGVRVCDHCGSGIEDIVKKSWTINNISKY